VVRVTTAFVLSGGGSLGAAQVGMLRALIPAGILPDVVIGTSVGASNGLNLAARPDMRGLDSLTEEWRELARHEVTPFDPAAALRALLESLPWNPLGGLLRATGALNWVFTVDPFTITLAAMGFTNYFTPSRNQRQRLRRTLPVQRLEDCVLPVHLMTAEVTTGSQVALSEGDAVEAVLACGAIPGVFPNVTIGDRALVDGGVTANTAIDHAVALGVDRIYVLPCGFSCALPSPPRTVLDMAMHSFNLMLEQQLIVAVGEVPEGVELLVVPPLCPVTVTPADFSQSEELMERAERSTTEWLDNGNLAVPGLSRALGPHRHGPGAHDESDGQRSVGEQILTSVR